MKKMDLYPNTYLYDTKTTGRAAMFVDAKPTIINDEKKYPLVFLTTGYIDLVNPDKYNKRLVKDPTYPCIANVGYIGHLYKHNKIINEQDPFDREIYNNFQYTIDKDYKNIHKKGLFTKWACMILSCYDSKFNSDNFKRGYKVHPRWHSFSNFLEDLQYLPKFEDACLHHSYQYTLNYTYILNKYGIDKKYKFSPFNAMWEMGNKRKELQKSVFKSKINSNYNEYTELTRLSLIHDEDELCEERQSYVDLLKNKYSCESDEKFKEEYIKYLTSLHRKKYGKFISDRATAHKYHYGLFNSKTNMPIKNNFKVINDKSDGTISHHVITDMHNFILNEEFYMNKILHS